VVCITNIDWKKWRHEKQANNSEPRGFCGAQEGILSVGAEILGRVYLASVGITPSKGGDAYKIAVGGAVALGKA